MQPSIVLEGVRKSYAGQQVLRGLDLSVSRGEIVGLLGPNGSGKTTTLRIAAGYTFPDDGRVTVCGLDYAVGGIDARRRVGYLPERPPLYDSLTVGSYLDFVAAAKEIPSQHRTRAVGQVLDAYNLGAVRGKRIDRLSKGFRQRVGLAQATLGDPEVLLLDEATNGLDPLQIVEAREMIRVGGAGRAVIFSTHIMQEVVALCSRVIVLHLGRAISVDPSSVPSTSGRNQVIEVEVGGMEAQRAREILAAVAGVRDVAIIRDRSPNGALLRCAAEPGEDVRDALARAVMDKARLLGLHGRGSTLEDVLVARMSREDEPDGSE